MNQAAARLLATLPACFLINMVHPLQALADDIASACPQPALAPVITDLPEREGAPLYLKALEFDARKPEGGKATGAVELFRADQYLSTEVLQYSPTDRTITVPGPLIYRDAQISIEADSASMGLLKETGSFENVRYGFVGSTAHGAADHVTVLHRDHADLQSIWFTTCPGENPEWRLSAKELDLYLDKGRGVAKGAVLRLSKVPVLYVPWMSFPIDNRRKTGFLYPHISTANDNGVEFGIPWYWNIAPNQDATLTPRFYTDRGFMLTSEYRLLTRRTGGLLEFDYLPDDKETRTDRWHYLARFDAAINPSWRGTARLERVSDNEFFQDFGGSLASTSRQYLRSNAEFDGAGRWWIFSILLDDFQVIDDAVRPRRHPYRRLPRVGFKLDAPLGRQGFQFGLDSELVYFDHDVLVSGARADVYPSLSWSSYRYWGFFRASAGYRYTAYDLDLGSSPGDDSPDRGLGIFSLDSGMYFERLLDNGDTQTLEPRIYYLYVPFENQDTLPDFDTGEFTFGFAQLFHYNRFTGADRQTDANQVTLAASTRSIDASSGFENWNLNFGQVFYLESPRVTLDEDTPEDPDLSPFLAEFNWRPMARVNGRVAVEWDWEDSELNVGAFGVAYTGDSGARVAFEYRFRRDRLDQFDIRYFQPINERWRLFSRLNYSLEDSDLLETSLGVEYESCCWTVRVMARRYLKDREGGTRDALYLELRLKGLGSFGRSAPPLFYDLGY